jgi:hypothetical protein
MKLKSISSVSQRREDIATTIGHTPALELADYFLPLAARIADRPRQIDRYIDYFGGAARRTVERHDMTKGFGRLGPGTHCRTFKGCALRVYDDRRCP